MRLPVFVFHDDELHLAYKCQSVTSDRQWIETFCFSEGHNEVSADYLESASCADLSDPAVIEFVVKAQAYRNHLPGNESEFIPVSSWEDVSLPA